MLRDIWMGMLIVGTLLFVVSMVLMFTLRIPDLIDELSGRKAKRQIKRLRELNIGTGALDGMPTDEVYATLSSASLLSDSVVSAGSEFGPQNKKSSIDAIGNKFEDSEINQSKAYTKLISNEVDDSGETDILSDDVVIQTKHVIKIIEEQTSL